MKVTNHNEPGSIVLSRLVDQEGWDRTFKYDGYTYALISGIRSAHHTLQVTNYMYACINLKSHTIRALPQDTPVLPLRSHLETWPRS